MIGSVQEFADLIASENEDDFLRATTDIAPTFVWEEIIRKRPDLAEFVTQSATIPDSVLETVALAAPWRARYLVATQERTPPSILAKLAHDGDSRVQRAALANDATPLKVVAQLRDDRHEEIAKLAKLIWEDRAEKRAGKHSSKGDRLWDVPHDEAGKNQATAVAYRTYFDELVAAKGMTSADVVRGFDPRDPELPLAPEDPWVVAPWGDEEYVVGSQRGSEFAIYDMVDSLEEAVDLVYRLCTEVLPVGELPADAPQRGQKTGIGIDARTISRGGKPGSNELHTGDLLDCFDDDKAQFLFALGTPLAARGMKLDQAKPYRVFEVRAPLPMAVLEGLTAETNGNPGGGAIVVLDRPLRWYLDQGFLLELK
ncbi:MAG: TNT domain-containing protein [Mobiluncus sp.]|uniref:DUF4237 domain-containing protein n=1 Tax=Mobiluncus porci TaxID=2652278 RepID=A0A7K0K418_9ACTO|nr:TNT domain-containing protein [Mobiluncus sp.]MCI6584537.1 TNT domain-containing protein [Mobiluncus sp.]MST50179.1 DUF4237 domain-containing protein [Mobiluncus porci]